MGGGQKFPTSIDLPVIDFAQVYSGQSAQRNNQAENLINAFTDYGFCLISNLPDYNQDEVFEAIKFFYYGTTAEERFDQLAHKSFNRKNDNLYRGLFPLIPGKLSHKEGYDMGPFNYGPETPQEKQERNLNPFYGDTPKLQFPLDKERQNKTDEFYKVIEKHWDILDKAASTMMSLIAEAGNAKSDYFAQTFEPVANNTYRLIMYPNREEKDIPKGAFLPDGRTISTPAHQDSGFLTLLQTFGFSGLELQLDDVWYSVPCPKGMLVVNVGEQLAAMSNNRFKATIHRVLDIGQDRFSNPFFYEPCLDANINIKIPKSLLWTSENVNGLDEDEEFTYGSFLLNKLPIYTEWDYLIANLPQFLIDKYLSNRKKKISCWATQAGIQIDGKSYDSSSIENK